MRVERLLPLQLTERCSGEQDERGEAKRGGDMRDEEREPWDGGGGLELEWMGEVEDEKRGGRAKQYKRAGNVGKGKEMNKAR